MYKNENVCSISKEFLIYKEHIWYWRSNFDLRKKLMVKKRKLFDDTKKTYAKLLQHFFELLRIAMNLTVPSFCHLHVIKTQNI